MLIAEQTALDQKVRELCQTLLDQPNFSVIRERINTFLGDDHARGQYDILSLKGQGLQQKQSMGLPLTEQEVEEFNKLRDEMLANPVAKNFLDAQQEMNQIHDSVMKHLTKTFELGRVPEADDMNDGSCCSGGGCGCH